MSLLYFHCSLIAFSGDQLNPNALLSAFPMNPKPTLAAVDPSPLINDSPNFPIVLFVLFFALVTLQGLYILLDNIGYMRTIL